MSSEILHHNQIKNRLYHCPQMPPKVAKSRVNASQRVSMRAQSLFLLNTSKFFSNLKGAMSCCLANFVHQITLCNGKPEVKSLGLLINNSSLGEL